MYYQTDSVQCVRYFPSSASWKLEIATQLLQAIKIEIQKGFLSNFQCSHIDSLRSQFKYDIYETVLCWALKNPLQPILSILKQKKGGLVPSPVGIQLPVVLRKSIVNFIFSNL